MGFGKQVLFFAAAIIFSCIFASGQNLYYVNDASTTGDVYTTNPGNDANPGTSVQPKLTVQAILDAYALNGKDTIFVDVGTYADQTITITKTDQGKGAPSAQYVVIKGAGRTKTIFQNSAGFAGDNMSILEAEYIRIQGISFQNSGVGRHNIYKQEGDYSTITNCEFIINAASGSGINIYFRATDPVSKLNSNYCNISNNLITNSTPGGRGIYFLGNCDYSLIASNNISISSSGGTAMNFQFTSSSSGGSTYYHWPILDTIRSNTITSAGTGISLVGGTTSDKRHILTGYTIEKNTITITNRSAASNTGLIMENTGDFGVSGVTQDAMYIRKNRFIGGYSGIICQGYTRSITTSNNYFCKPTFGIRVDYWDGADSECYFVHNTVYSYAQCMYFDNYASNGSQYKWRIRNNIFLTLLNSTGEVLFFYGNESMEASDYNLFFRPNNSWVADFNGNNYDKNTWPALSSPDPTALFGGADANSLFPTVMPNFQDTANCDLDLVVDNTTYAATGGYPTAVGGGYTSIVTDDIKNTPRLVDPTIGAFESTSTLPFNLIDFNLTRKEGNILLLWTVSKDNEIKYYKIEKSLDAVSWVGLGIVQVIYKQNNVNEYQFTDASGTGGKIYYRIKAINYDGRDIGSAIRSIAMPASSRINIFPNPGKNIFTISGLSKGKSHQLRILDITGKMIQSVNTSADMYHLQMTNAAPGVYFIQVDGKEYLRFVKTQ
jgi:hypothetical protein